MVAPFTPTFAPFTPHFRGVLRHLLHILRHLLHIINLSHPANQQKQNKPFKVVLRQRKNQMVYLYGFCVKALKTALKTPLC